MVESKKAKKLKTKLINAHNQIENKEELNSNDIVIKSVETPKGERFEETGDFTVDEKKLKKKLKFKDKKELMVTKKAKQLKKLMKNSNQSKNQELNPNKIIEDVESHKEKGSDEASDFIVDEKKLKKKLKSKGKIKMTATKKAIKEENQSENQELNLNEIVNEVPESSKISGDDEIGEFTLLGEIEGHKLEKVSRKLPDWLANPTIIEVELKAKLSEVNEISGLHQHLIQRLHEKNISSFFPVQKEVIPILLQDLQCPWARSRDICVSAPTGSGKTLAFVLPLIQALLNRQVIAVRALAVLPVQDLAEQVYQVFQSFCQGTDLKVGLMTGKLTFPLEQQQLVRERHVNVSLDQDRRFCSKVDIIVATPGRLVDHILRTPGFTLNQLRFLVIDEADRMMEEIKHNWLSQVESMIYQEGGVGVYPGVFTAASTFNVHVPFQKLLFSATLSHNPEKLEQLNLFLPRLFTSSVSMSSNVSDSKDDKFIGKYMTPAELKEYFVNCPTINKPLVLLHLLHNLKYRQVICFTNSIGTTYRLYQLLTAFGNLNIQQFSSTLHTKKRSKLLKQFSDGKIDVLISTDATARGIDIFNVDYVISYDKPPHIKNYIHRVGRTARAGRVGVAITFLNTKEKHHFNTELKEIGKTNLTELKLDTEQLNLLMPQYEKALEQLADLMKNKETKKKLQRKKMKG